MWTDGPRYIIAAAAFAGIPACLWMCTKTGKARWLAGFFYCGLLFAVCMERP